MSDVIHHNDADGRCSAAIVKRWWDECGHDVGADLLFHEVDYKDPDPLKGLGKEGQVFIVDFSLKPEVFAKLRQLTTNIVWCDHHVTAAAYDYGVEVAGLRDFSNKGLSGAEVTWKYLFPNEPVPRAVELLGDYDSWRLVYAPKCFEFYEGLKLEDQSPASDLWPRLFGGSEVWATIDRLLLMGKTAVAYRDNYCREMRDAFGYETEIGGQRAYALNCYRFGSGAYAEKMKEYPVCIGYVHDGKRFTVSLYSETVDVSAIAKTFGGGGHKGASGFVCETLPFGAILEEVQAWRERK